MTDNTSFPLKEAASSYGHDLLEIPFNLFVPSYVNDMPGGKLDAVDGGDVFVDSILSSWVISGNLHL
jgi:hypothetical protein